MDIKFSGKCSKDHKTFGVSFDASVDGAQARCLVDTDALQDIDPTSAMDDAMVQFTSNRSAFEEIARKLILSGRLRNLQVLINSADVRAYLGSG